MRIFCCPSTIRANPFKPSAESPALRSLKCFSQPHCEIAAFGSASSSAHSAFECITELRHATRLRICSSSYYWTELPEHSNIFMHMKALEEVDLAYTRLFEAEDIASFFFATRPSLLSISMGSASLDIQTSPERSLAKCNLRSRCAYRCAEPSHSPISFGVSFLPCHQGVSPFLRSSRSMGTRPIHNQYPPSSLVSEVELGLCGLVNPQRARSRRYLKPSLLRLGL